jgi:uncharacterized membrane protein (UPF0136 family)
MEPAAWENPLKRHPPPMKNKKSRFQDYARYSSIGIQMAFGVIFFALLGVWADKKLALKVPVFTILGVLTGVGSVVYFVIKKFGK